MEKTVIIDGQEVRMRASALIPRIYRAKFGRDMIADMRRLERKYAAAVRPDDAEDKMTEEEKAEAQFTALDLTCFENLAYCMAVNGGGRVPADPDAWLDSFNTFSIYEVLPEIIDLWQITNVTTAEPAKKAD